MRRFFSSLSLLSLVLVAACNTSSLTESQQESLPSSAESFSGAEKDIDMKKSSISFIGKSSIVDHEGKFNAYTVTITPGKDASNFEDSTIEVDIDMTSVETDSKGLDGHLQKADFFDTTEYPTATFTSTSITNTEGTMYNITGNLTLKGQTKEVTFRADVTDAYLEATYDLPRKEFGIGNDTYGEKLLESTVPVTVRLVFQN